ncbi:MAG: PilZ domain-containing protein [Clostridiaceae bacterium]|jgi:c-di-GMP-binding flagellar brake protein YcgR|nr:PilZ domain-containing protein [Clostridiaceae bacterium]
MDSKRDDSRKNKRVGYYSKIQCIKSIQGDKTEEYEEPLELTLINISAGGLGIISEKTFEKDAVLTFNLKLEEKEYKRVLARVIWIMEKDGKFKYGLEIVNMSGRLYKHLSLLDNGIMTTV